MFSDHLYILDLVINCVDTLIEENEKVITFDMFINTICYS